MSRACLRSLLWGSLAAALTLCSGRAAAQVADDIISQEISVELGADELVVEVRVLVLAETAVARLDLPVTSIPVEGVEVDGVPVDAAPDARYPDYLINVDYPTPLAVGDTAEVVVHLRGTPHCSVPGYGGLVLCSHSATETVLSPSSPGLAWYHVDPWESDPFVGSLEVHAPPTFEVVAPQGSAVEVLDGPEGLRTWRFELPTETELLGLYAGAADVVESSGGFPVRGYFHDAGERRAKMSHAVDLAAAVLDHYQQLYGPLPADQAAIVNVPPDFAFGGMGLLGMVLWGEYILEDYDYLLEQGVAHEFAHSWWGNQATAADYDEAAFFSESFAEYSAWRALGAIQGEVAGISGYRMNAIWYMYGRPGSDDLAVLAPGVAESPLYVYLLYHKGPVVLRTLEHVCGTQPFSAALHAFVARGYAQLTVSALLDDLAAEGCDVSTQVQQWLRRPGFPRLSAAVALGSGERPTAALTLEVEGDFALALPLRFTFSDGSVQDEVVTAGPGASAHEIALPQAPALVEIDPAWSMVREVNPARPGDVTLDGQVDAADLIEVALRQGGQVPNARRIDGRYDPLYDVNRDRRIDSGDLTTLLELAD